MARTLRLNGKLVVGFVFVCLMALSTLSTGCLDNRDQGSREFIDDMGGSISIEGVPTKMITLTPALTEIVFLLGIEDRLVGCDFDSNHPPEADRIEKVSSWSGINAERIVEIGPDIIFMDNTLDASGSRYSELVGLGLVVYRIYPGDLDDVLANIEAIAEIMGVKDKGEEVSYQLRERIDAVGSRASKDPPGRSPSVLHMVYYEGNDDPWVMTDSTFSGDLIAKAGGSPAIKSSMGLSVQISLERIIDADPDIIICSQSSLWPTQTRSLLLNDTRLSGVRAIFEGSVYDIEGDIIDRTGPRLIDGLEEIRDLIEEFHEGD